jgi:hypothetical protein
MKSELIQYVVQVCYRLFRSDDRTETYMAISLVIIAGGLLLYRTQYRDR